MQADGNNDGEEKEKKLTQRMHNDRAGSDGISLSFFK